jgi:hypothetical protein
MKNRKMLLPALLSIALIFSLILPASAAGASVTVPMPDDRSIGHWAVDSSSAAPAMALNTPQGPVTPMVAAGGSGHIVGLKSDGTVVAMGDNSYGQCNVGGWTDITQVAAGGGHTVGLKSDGTVVAAGYNDDGECNVGGWTDITQVTAGWLYTVGLKSDGTVVAVGYNDNGECNVGGWTDITQVAAGSYHTVGVKSDGTVVAVGSNADGQCNVGGWRDITRVAAGHSHTVGLKSDGTVVTVGDTSYGQCDVGDWTDITRVAAGAAHTVGLKSDGTVVAVGWNSSWQCAVGNWTDIARVAAGFAHTVGLKADGTVVDAGLDIDLAKWNLVLAVPPSQCILTISSTIGGNVTTPGEGTFTHDKGTVVNLVAEPEEGYRFVNWAGDVDTIGNVTAAATNITMDDNYSITANFVSVTAGNVSIKAGDWIKIQYKITGWPAGQPYPEWLRLEFLSVEGTSATTRATMHMSDGTEQSDTVPVDCAGGGGEAFGLSGFVIAANLTTGDSVYMSGYGNVTIAGKTTRTYAGASRTVVYASISQYGLTYYWDKLTGVMVESSTTYSGITATAKATETNMWEASPPAVGMAWWLWVIVAVVVVALALVIYRLKKRKTPTTPTLPTEGT